MSAETNSASVRPLAPSWLCESKNAAPLTAVSAVPPSARWETSRSQSARLVSSVGCSDASSGATSHSHVLGSSVEYRSRSRHTVANCGRSVWYSCSSHTGKPCSRCSRSFFHVSSHTSRSCASSPLPVVQSARPSTPPPARSAPSPPAAPSTPASHSPVAAGHDLDSPAAVCPPLSNAVVTSKRGGARMCVASCMMAASGASPSSARKRHSARSVAVSADTRPSSGSEQQASPEQKPSKLSRRSDSSQARRAPM
mmetsp:Transcript_1225/g.3212  ORF Transcript_1225/g.3212 Transcript_1225/m.3212 type:complete len:254 (-) Transcript_1225:3797-4558(-)|eukprot:3708704-Prymnesium_polylepis.3